MQLFTRLMLTTALAAASPPDERQSCPNIHVFSAPETTVPSGYGSAGAFVTLIQNAYPGSTAEVINYPALGGASYASSVQQGTQNIASQINSFNSKCPNSKLVIGAHIGDNALCGGGDSNQGIMNTSPLITTAASAQIKVVIWAGNPRNSPAESSFHVGSCTAGGYDARPNGFSCSNYSGKLVSYCDASDPYCCNGNNAATHQSYGNEYGQQALAFAQARLS